MTTTTTTTRLMLMLGCRRMEEELVASQQAAQDQETASLVSPLSPVSGVSARTKRNGGVAAGPGSPSAAGDSLVAEEETFTGISCLLITWKSNPEVEQFKVRSRSRYFYNLDITYNYLLLLIVVFQELYMSEQRKSKDQKKRNKAEAIKVPQDLVSEQSVEKNYKVLGKVDIYLRNVCCECM